MVEKIKDIIDSLLQDSPQAMKRMFDLFYKPLCVYAVRYASSMAVAEEIVSDVMYKIWENRHRGYRADTFREYLFSATRNTALNYRKQQENRRTLADNWAYLVRDELIEETPLDALIAEESQSQLSKLMDSLPEQCRKAFLMSRLDDMSYEEIADQMGITTNTVKYHIKTALQKLRAEIDNILIFLLSFFTFSVNSFTSLFLFIIIIPYLPFML